MSEVTILKKWAAELGGELELQRWGLKKTNDAIKVLYRELEKKNIELKKLDDLKSSFVSHVSHELRTPLTAIKEGLGIVLDGCAGALNDDQKKFLEIAKKNVDRLARLINDVLDFQKLESGKMVFRMEPNDINDVIKEVFEAQSNVAKEKGLQFFLNLQDDVPEIDFDRDRIIQVLTNLVNNALKFTEEGSITVATQLVGNTVRVSVRDTGCGIRQEDAGKLFQSFEQLSEGGGRKVGGTGLGLAICREIIEKHKGKIWVESRHGEGAAFHFVLVVEERRGRHG